MSRLLNLLFISLLSCVFLSQTAEAKTIKIIHDGSAYYASFYLSWSIGGSSDSRTYEGKGEGWSETLELPNSATNILLKVRSNKFLGAYSDACSKSAGSQGGTFTLTGMLHSENCTFIADGNTTEKTLVGIDHSQMDVLLPNGNSQLFSAVTTKDHRMMNQLIDAGTSHINTKNRQGQTPLHKAVQTGDSVAVLALLNVGADLSVTDNAGMDPMMLAISRRKYSVTRAFLAQGVMVSNAHLAKAVATRDMKTVTMMLNNSAVEPSAVLAEAQKTNNVQMMNLATENGAPVTMAAFTAAVSGNKIPQAIKYLDEPTSTIDLNQAMTLAIQRNSKPLVKALLEKGGNPNAALAFAVKVKDETIANDAILVGNADANAVLSTIIAQKNLSMLSLVLNAGADENRALALAVPTKDSRLISAAVMAGATASDEQMRTAGAVGDVTLLKMLVDQASGSADAGLSGAVSASKWKAAEALIGAGATPQGIVAKAVSANQLSLVKVALAASDDAQPGLAPAINGGNKEMIKTILKAGATTSDPALVNLVIDKKDASIMSMLLSSGTPSDVGMPHAVKTGQTEMVKLMLDNSADGSLSSYMQTAASAGNTEICNLLLEAGGDSNVGLQAAVNVGSTSITTLMLGKGADGTSAGLMAASVKHNSSALTQALLDAGGPASAIVGPAIDAGAHKPLSLAIAEGEDVSSDGYLVKAVRGDKTTILPLLLRNGADADFVDGSGNSMLHMAASSASLGVLQSIKSATSLEINVVNSAGDAPLHLAVKRGKSAASIVEMLISSGADVNLVNSTGKRPRDLAKSAKVKKLLKKSGAQKSK